MAWSDANNHQGQLVGARAEWGTATIGSDGTVEVPTNLNNIKAVALTPVGTAGMHATPLMCDLTITTGYVTVTDPVGALNSGRVFTYILIGLP